MKRDYEAPVMVMEEYTLNNRVSACTPETFVPPIDIDCSIKSGEQHGVYDTGYTGTIPEGYSKCTTDDSAIGLVTLGKTGDTDTTYTTYAYWYGPRGGQPSAGYYNSSTGEGSGNALMNALVTDGKLSNPGGGDTALHAGPASTTLISWLNHS